MSEEKFDWEKWGSRGLNKNTAAMQQSGDATTQSIGDIVSFASTGATLGGAQGAAVGTGIGVIKSALNISAGRKAARETRRAKQRQDRRIESLRKEELNYRKKELQADREGTRYNREQDIELSRQNSAANVMNKLNGLMSDNASFRQSMIEKGYA